MSRINLRSAELNLIMKKVLYLKAWDFRNSKTCVKQPLKKRPKIDFQDRLSLNAGQKYCRMLQEEHSAILLTVIKLPFVIKILICLFLGGCFTQVLLYVQISYGYLAKAFIFFRLNACREQRL